MRLFIFIAMFLCGIFPAHAQSGYDLVIAGGRVIDPESGLDAVRHIGIKDKRIAAVSETPLSGARTLDAAGLVVTPGFIDLHSHALTVPSMRMQAFDGVTTALELELGSLPIAAAYDLMAKEGQPINYGFSVSWAMARMKVLDEAPLTGSTASYVLNFRKPNWSKATSSERMADILAEVEKGLREGGIGVGIMVGYAPQTGADEFVALHRLAARYGVPTFTHIRKPDADGFREVIAAAKETGAHAHLCHINSSSTRQIRDVVNLISEAQRDGVRLTTEAYPYGAGSTTIGAAFLAPAVLAASGRARPQDIYVVDTDEWVKDAEHLEKLRRERPTAIAVIHYLREDEAGDQQLLAASLLLPNTAIASDAIGYLAAGRPIARDTWPLPDNALAHPRVAGTFSRVLGEWVRERKIMPLNEAVRRATLVPAQILEQAVPQMRGKGRIKVGADADIVVFDAATIADRATYKNPRTPSRGMRHVVVGGTPVIEGGELKRDAFPGQPVRGVVR